MSDESLHIEKLSMFYPKTTKGLVIDYPEIASNPVLKALNKNDLLFVWYYACRASPFVKEDNNSVKIENAAKEAYGRTINEGLLQKLLAGNFSDKMRHAIVEMEKFQVGPRIRAKMMVEKIMGNYSTLVDIDPKTDFQDKDGEEDWTKKKAYIDSCAKISSALPLLISQSEGGFGMIETEPGEAIDINPHDIIDAFHDTEN